MKPRTSIIAAVGRNRVLGKNNRLLWNIPEDLRRFKALTLGKPLPGRTNIVLVKPEEDASALAGENVVIANSIPEALQKAHSLDNEVFVIGGAQIYTQALHYADRLCLTLIDDDKEGDAFFPEYESLFTKKISEEEGESGGLKYRWLTLEK